MKEDKINHCKLDSYKLKHANLIRFRDSQYKCTQLDSFEHSLFILYIIRCVLVHNHYTLKSLSSLCVINNL